MVPYRNLRGVCSPSAAALTIDEAQKQQLESWARGGATPQRVARKCEAILLASLGVSNVPNRVCNGNLPPSRVALRHMVRHNYGRIVNVSSNAGRRGNAECPIYSGIKPAVIALTKSNAADFGAYGITVNTICPKAWTEMERMNKPIKPERDPALVPGIGDVTADVAPAAVFLCSEAAGYITAQVIGLEGGVYR